MDEELRQRYAEAQARIEAERARRGIVNEPLPARERLQIQGETQGRLSPMPDVLTAFLDRLGVVADDEAFKREREMDAERQRDLDRQALGSKIAALQLPLPASDLRRLLAGELDDTRFVRAIRTWRTTDRPWIVLSGPVGRGKTLAAAEACVGERRKSRYVRARELERIFTARYGDEVEMQQTLIDCRGVLVIDDIGRERDADGMAAALLDLVDTRRGDGRKSIAITNLSSAQFQARYPDERLWSRLVESAAWVTDRGPDMRRSGAGE